MSDKDFKVKNKLIVNGLNNASGVILATSNTLDSHNLLPTQYGGTGTTTSPSTGQIPYSTAGSTYAPTAINTLDVKGATYNSTAPSNPVVGQLWADAASNSDNLDPNIIRRKTITATAGQTVFTTDVPFTDAYEQVFYNGVLIVRTVDYTTNGGASTVTLLQGASAGDTIEILSITNLNTINAATTGTNTFTGNQIVNGNLGVNISSPVGKIHSIADSGGSPLFLGMVASDTTSWIQAKLQRNNYEQQAAWLYTPSTVNASNPVWYTGLNASSANFVFSTYDSANFVERMHITPSGNVGIGKNNPTYTIDITGSFAITGNAGGALPGFSSGLVIVQNSINGSAEITYSHSDPTYATSGGHRFIQKTGASTARSLMYLRGDGNVGIGKDGPSYKLDVDGVVNSTGYYGPMVGGTNLKTVADYTVFAANTDTKIADLSSLGNGLFGIYVSWGYGDNNAGSQLYWSTAFGGMVGLTSNGVGAYFNGSAANPITMSATQHHRNAATLPTFFLKSDATAGSYGSLSLYIRFTEITRIDGFLVIGKRFY